MGNELYYNFKKSLEQKYNAVCFDIDGTLTEKKSKLIDRRAIAMIIELLKKKVPILFITERDENELKNFKKEFFSEFEKCSDITDSDIKRIYLLVNNGIKLYFSNSMSYLDFLSHSVYLCSNEELEKIAEIKNLIDKINNQYFDIIYSEDLETHTILNIKLVFNTDNIEIVKKTYNIVLNIMRSNGITNISITRSFYGNNPVILISAITKDVVFEKIEKMIGIPQHSMLRIADCGDDFGNDYLMLNCKQGYSVDKISGMSDKCFPIFDDDKNICLFSTKVLLY